ncbi:uncharacterized protein E5676_scaffold629G00870 [Cucumis melo var. makuwa]|uniref:Stress up-regulated Nod 19 protein n=1 Tax=Cucumis melo var. makuwa TaxID=1194695 RepID=A0A5D3DYQ2_CUCMM|nr:uncharacterized protein E5676_scaffold629G00870 [Cucumis melo var. makuwa]
MTNDDFANSIIIAGNNGVCQPHSLPYFYGMGTESRKTSNLLPDLYVIEVGNEKEVPLGYEEKWVLNVHAIDTRGVEDRIGCLECKCNLYDVNKDKLDDDYKGGFKCCYDKAQCKVKEVYVFDVTDTWKPSIDSSGLISQEHDCQLHGKCNANKRSKVMFQDNGFIVYGVVHQHIGAIGATLYGEDGRVLCSSLPIYGEGDEIGNEDG